jgi:AraC-like DNA-binding protein
MLGREADRELIPGRRGPGLPRQLLTDHVILADSGKQLTNAFGGWIVREQYPEPTKRDIHQAFELGVLLAGSQDRHFDDHKTSLRPGDLYLSPAWECHGWQTTSPGTRTLVMHFLPSFLGEESFEGTSWFSLFALPPRDRPHPATDDLKQQVLARVGEIVHELGEKRVGWLAAVRLHVLGLLCLLWREWKATGAADRHSPAGVGDLGRISPAIELVRSRPERRTTLEEASEACSLGRSQFSIIFRKAMGLSFGRFVSRYRVLRAAEMLLSFDRPLQQIAEELEFTDAAHLHREFVKHYGCTPGAYRKGAEIPDLISHSEAGPASPGA